MKKVLFGFLLMLLAALYAQQAIAQKESHKDYASMKIAECNACHTASGVTPNHDPDWVRSHRLAATRGAARCAECHPQSWCLDCHTGGGIDAKLSTQNYRGGYIPKSHRSDFVSIHPIKAKDNPQTCTRCHEASFCSDCHARFPKGSLRIKSHLPSGAGQTFIWNSEHASEARRNLQSCQACHPEGDVCIRCHGTRAKGGSAINPHPKSFKGGNIRDRSDRSCTKCH